MSVNKTTSSQQPYLKWAQNTAKVSYGGVCLTAALCVLRVSHHGRAAEKLDKVIPKLGTVSVTALFTSGVACMGLTPPKGPWIRPR